MNSFFNLTIILLNENPTEFLMEFRVNKMDSQKVFEIAFSETQALIFFPTEKVIDLNLNSYKKFMAVIVRKVVGNIKF